MKSTVYSLQPAFSLVELLVVLAILAILLTLLIPNIRAMREKARSSQCQNNLRQYGVAMNQYMADNNGYFVYPGAGGHAAGSGFDANAQDLKTKYDGGIRQSGGQVGSVGQSWGYMIAYLSGGVTIQSLSDGKPSVRVCPAILQQIQNDGNFFDPNSPNFKGNANYTGSDGLQYEVADFEAGWGVGTTNQVSDGSDTNSGLDAVGNLTLSVYFTTYAINPMQIYQSASNCPANAIAFIDWNAKEGWGANLYNPSGTYQFNSLDGSIVQGVTPKWTNAWWLTEVGFNHRQGGEYGANYVAMDGHVAWISSNTISITNFTGR